MFVEHSLAIDHDTLHLLTGVLLWLLFATILRRPITSWRPWLAILGVILINETADLWFEIWPEPGRQYGEGAKDILVTMALPTLLMVAARVRPALFAGRPSR